MQSAGPRCGSVGDCESRLQRAVEPEPLERPPEEHWRVDEDEPATRLLCVGGGIEQHVQSADIDEREVAEVADHLWDVVLRSADRFARTAGGGDIELADHHDADRIRFGGVAQTEEPRIGLRPRREN